MIYTSPVSLLLYMCSEMSKIKWNNIFDEVLVNNGASDDEIATFIATVSNPLSREEQDCIRQEQCNPFPAADPLYSTWRPFDPGEWSIPSKPFPGAYLHLLKWSNGAECRTGDRWFQFFPANDIGNGVRAMLLTYHLPQYMPGAMPFAFDGGGIFYLFDMHTQAKDGEYSIVCSTSGSLGFGDAVIADSFVEACQGQQDVGALIFGD